MPSPVEIGFEANGEQSVRRAWESIAKSVEDNIRTLAKLTPESNRADEAQRRLGASAEKWLKAISTPMQDYLGDLEELQQLLNAGKISQDQYGLAVDQVKNKLNQQNIEIDHLAAKADKLRASLITPQQKYQQELAESNELLQANKITQDEYAAAVDRAQKSLDAQNTELQDLIRLGAQIKQAVQTPQDRYNDALSKADRALKAGKISQADYNRAVAQAGNDLRNATHAQDEFSTHGQKAHQNIQQAAEGTAAKLLGIQTAYNTIMKGVQAVVQENNRFNESIQRTVDLGAEEETKLQIQAGMLPVQVEQQMPAIKKALTNTPVVAFDKAIQIQTQLASSGFQQADVQGGAALQTTLDLMAATNQYGRNVSDPKQMTKAISMYLKGSGNLAPGAADIRQSGGRLATLFESSDIQFTDLEQLARHTATLSGAGISQEDQFASYSTLVDVMGGEKGGTGLRAFVSRLSTAAGSKERTKALKSAGLKPDDVDIAKGGDQLVPTIEKLSSALANKTEEQKNLILNEIFGEEAQSAAAYLIKPETIQLIKSRVAAQGEDNTFDRNVTLFQGSRFARNMRNANAQQFAERDIDKQRGGTTWKEANAAGEAMRAQYQADGTIGGTRRALAGAFSGMWNAAAEGLGYAPPKVEDLQAGRIRGDKSSPLEQAIQANSQGQLGVAGLSLDQALKPDPTVNPFGDGKRQGAENEAKELIDAIKNLTEATKENSKKPPINIKKPVNQPSKSPVSAQLAAAGGR